MAYKATRNFGLGGAFRYSVGSSVASALALAIAAPAVAQDAGAAADEPSSENGSDEAIVVTGYIGSLQRNLDAKREAPGVVDVISSEEIGNFPDSNVAASLQRLPGVSIQRDGARGEANGVTIRGFGGDFNETLVDGRRLSTATGGRSIDFSTVGSDFIGALTVYKTPDVSVAANSIGATIDISYPRPLDRPGFHVAATASASVQEDAGKVVPTGGLLISNTFADDSFGILGSVIYTRHDTQTNNVFVHGFPGGYYAPCQLAGSTAATCNPTNNATAPASDQRTIVGFFEQQYGAQQTYTKDERVDARLALQWRPTDDLLITLDDNYSDQRVNAETFGFGIWFNQGSLRNVVLDDNGVPLDFTQAGSQTDFTAATDSNLRRTNITGLNVEWEATDNLTFEADGSYSKSWLNPDDRVNSRGADIGYGFAIGPSLGISIDGNSDSTIPVLHSYGPNGNPSRWADPAVIGSHVTVNIANKNTDEILQGRFAGKWEQDDLTLTFGGSYLDDSFKFNAAHTFANNFWQAYSGYGPASGTTGGVPIPADLYRGFVSTDNFIPGFDGALPPTLIDFSAIDYQAFLTGLGNPQATTIPGYNYGCCGTAFTGTFDVAEDVGSFRKINEKTWALFLSGRFQTEVAGMPLTFTAGVRQESTRVSSTGIGRLPTSITPSTTDPTLLTVNFGPSQEVTTKADYSYLLPAVDVKLEVLPDLIVRFDASRTLTRPTLNLLTPVLNIGSGQRVGALTANGGNPLLRPGLPTRRGVGHVYSSHHISDDEAERELRAYLGGAGADQAVRKIPIRSGHRETFWKRNCVAVGLAAGFLEPLEASAIVLIELSAKLIAEQMPACREVMDVVAKRFNATTDYRWGRIIDFLKLHYVLSKRTDSAFWRDNRLPETIPERLQELLLLWSYQPPWFHDEFDRVEEVFPPASYQYVLYGMGFRTGVEPAALTAEAALADRAMRENRAQTEKLRSGLPRHRDLINKIRDHGLQPV